MTLNQRLEENEPAMECANQDERSTAMAREMQQRRPCRSMIASRMKSRLPSQKGFDLQFLTSLTISTAASSLSKGRMHSLVYDVQACQKKQQTMLAQASRVGDIGCKLVGSLCGNLAERLRH